MNKKIMTLAVASLLAFTNAPAQRVMEKLDRGLVAVKTTTGVYLSWRVLGEEYYGVAYNVYRDGQKVNEKPLLVSNFTDAKGSISSKYTIKPVVRGVEQSTASKEVTPLSNNYKEIKIAAVPSNADGRNISSYYEPNDATIADLDGDGEMEILLKLVNTDDSGKGYPTDGTDFDIIQVYKQDGTLLWWIDCGRNMVDFQSNEINIAAYDWDGDGKAECVLRGADGMVIHMADGTTQVIGDASVNTRGDLLHGSGNTFTHTGAEYLLYLNGETGKPYYVGEYPLKRLEAGETDLNAAWGDGYGHRSSKHFFGAPYLDGKKPSIFLGRGIYTRHKMIAYDVDPATHQLVERWRWFNNTPGAWYGQGYHNYTIADVDWDGRDEIVWGSMVIDDNGKGLSTSGLGHGDAHHVGSFNPYIHGQQVAACNEDQPANNFRDATTSKIFYRKTSGGDDGRAIAGNFTNDLIGAQFFSSQEGNLISCVTNKQTSLGTDNIKYNFRIYWDGDLLDETFDGTGSVNSPGCVYKYGSGRIARFEGTKVNNWTKATPCFQGDIFGDWREEVILRSDDNSSIRIMTTTTPTDYRIPTLLSDPQYRNAMITQMNGYNQPPHVSYFLGEAEGITTPAPCPTMNGKTEVKNGGSVAASLNDKEVVLAETGDATVSVADGAAPYIFFDNAPTWVQGHDNNDKIEYTTYTHTLTGGAFGGDMRLVKLGDGQLTLPKVEQKYTGNTEVWYGTLNFDGTMANSRVWLNRLATLTSDGGKFLKGIEANYGATVRIGSKDKISSIETDSLIMNFGSIAEFDIDADGNADQLKAKTLKIEKKDWKNGPEYLAPRFNFVPSGDLTAGTYKIAEIEKIEGDVNDIVLDGLKGRKATLSYENGVLSLNIAELRSAASVVWTANEDNVWNFADKENFRNVSSNVADVFVAGDDVTFNDEAKSGVVKLEENVSPTSITFDNSTLNYTISGDKAIEGTSTITKKGSANVTINTTNTFTGAVNIEDGKLIVNSLGVKDGNNNGCLGNYNNRITVNGGILSVNGTVASNHPITIGANDGTIYAAGTFTSYGAITGTGKTLTKTGNGALVLPANVTLGKLVIEAGTVYGSESNSVHAYPSTIVLGNATLRDPDTMGSYSTNSANVEIADGAKANWYLDSRCNYTGKLTGSGTLNVYATNIRNTIAGNWSQFEGTVNVGVSKTGSYDPQFIFDNTAGLPKATLTVNGPTTNNGKNFAIGNLAGAGELSGSGTWTIGALDKDIKFTGTIVGGKIVKTGAGTWTTATPLASLTGATTINGGVFNMNDTKYSAEFFGKFNVAVTGTGVLAGKGLVYSATVTSGGTLMPGNYTSVMRNGALKSTGNITCNKNTVAKFSVVNGNKMSTSRSFLEVGGTLTINGDIVVEAYKNYKAKDGDTFVLWTAKKFNGTPTSLVLPELPAGLEWDNSELYGATGVLKVVTATGIAHLTADTEFTGAVYTISGIKVANITTTKARLSQDLKSLGVGAGVYVIRVGKEVIKVTLK